MVQNNMTVVNMPFSQQSDRFTGLFFNVFNTTNRLLELGQTLRGKVKREIPLLSRFTGTRTTLRARSR
jgi:hypothetical protein